MLPTDEAQGLAVRIERLMATAGRYTGKIASLHNDALVPNQLNAFAVEIVTYSIAGGISLAVIPSSNSFDIQRTWLRRKIHSHYSSNI